MNLCKQDGTTPPPTHTHRWNTAINRFWDRAMGTDRAFLRWKERKEAKEAKVRSGAGDAGGQAGPAAVAAAKKSH